MRIRSSLVVGFLACCLTLGFASCSSNDDKATGTSASAAASQLTNAATFVGGARKAGALPASTSDVSLLPLDNAPVEPGGTSLLAFGVDGLRDDDPVSVTLLQFGDSDDHFEIASHTVPGDASADAGAAADGGATAAPEVHLQLVVASAVCAKLCDQIYDIELEQAVKLSKGGISKHVTTTIQLDCTTTGNHALCDKASSGQTTVTARALVDSYGQLNKNICSCADIPSDGCTVKQSELDCLNNVFKPEESALSSQLDCMQNYLKGQIKCVAQASCDVDKLMQCDFVAAISNDSTDAISAACGKLPADVQSALDTCGGKDLGSAPDGGVTPAQKFKCSSGEMLTLDQLCDGVMDCKDGGDEANICVMCPGETKKYSSYQKCDGVMDCSDGSDEMNCTGQ